MDRGSYTAGAMWASVAAGPAFCASMALTAWASADPTTYGIGIDSNGAGGVFLIVLAATVFGFFIAVVPNIIGSWFMHGLGIGNIAARLPVAWALVGAGAAGLPFTMIENPLGPLPAGAVFAFTGATCALIAHRFSTWLDPHRPPRARLD